MIFLTHLTGALVVSIIFLKYYNFNEYLFVIFALFGALFPDIDYSGSILGKRVKLLGFFAKHRYFFHSIVLAVLVSFFIYAIFSDYGPALGFFLGFTSHIALDSMTLSGVAVFSPFSDRKVKGFFKTNGIIEYIILLAFIVLIYYFLYL